MTPTDARALLIAGLDLATAANLAAIEARPMPVVPERFAGMDEIRERISETFDDTGEWP